MAALSAAVCYTSTSATDIHTHYPLSYTLFWLTVTTGVWFVYSHLCPFEKFIILFLPTPVGEFIETNMKIYRDSRRRRNSPAFSDSRNAAQAAAMKLCVGASPKHTSSNSGSETGSFDSMIVSQRFERDQILFPPPALQPPAGSSTPTTTCSAESLPSPTQGGPATSLSREEYATQFSVSCRHRVVGFTHAVFICPLALYCILLDPCLTADAMTGLSPAWTVTGMIMGGYFIWDLITVCIDWNKESWQFLLHAVICLISLISPFFARDVPMCYFAACLLLFEVSTPFMTLRYFCLKAGYADSFYCRAVGLGFLLAFLASRIVWAGASLFPAIFHSLGPQEFGGRVSWFRKSWYHVAMPTFYLLNLYWAYLIGVNIFGGSSKKVPGGQVEEESGSPGRDPTDVAGGRLGCTSLSTLATRRRLVRLERERTAVE
eukprot:GHVS01063469.1.p1 GENE.GHVS01063469.1~~GHVS01063469.1.p1  ORF type:complete len:461 (+),score=43.70 GHVS01063469.1:89-1384(+)